MKSTILLVFIFTVLTTSALSQAESNQEKVISLSAKAMKKRIIKQEFSDIPQSVRDCHATGAFYLRVKVDQEGIVKSANLYSGGCQKANEYVEKTIAGWKFKPLKVNKRKVSFVGHIAIPFCYGSFGSCY